MKRLFALVLAVLMVFSLFACGKKEASNQSNAGNVSENKDNSSNGNAGNATAPNEFYYIEAYQTLMAQGSHTVDFDLGIDEGTTVYPSDDAVLKVGVSAEPAELVYFAATSRNKGDACGYPMSAFLFNKDTETGKHVAGINTVGKSWEWIDDTHMRIVIRDNVTSINGDPFTASDLIYSFTWAMSVSGVSGNFKTFDPENSKVVSDTEAIIAFTDPTPFFEIQLGTMHLWVEKSVEAAGGKEACGQNPICGVGPYKLVEWNPGVSIIFERRDDFWGTDPYYKRIEMYISTDATARAMGLESGDFDIILDPSLVNVADAEDDDNISVYYNQGNTVMELLFNSTNEKFTKEVRQAIALAINYDAILQVAGKGYGTLCDSIFSPADPYYVGADENSELYWKYDPEAAKAKLVEAGYPDGFSFSITYKSGDTSLASTCEILKNNLSQVGIEVELLQFEAATWSDNVSKGDFEVYLCSSSNATPTRVFTLIDPRMTYATASGGCGSAWAPDGFGELLDRTAATVDSEKQFELLKDVQDIVREYVPLIPLYSPLTGNIASSKIQHIALGGTSVDLKWCYEADYLG